MYSLKKMRAKEFTVAAEYYAKGNKARATEIIAQYYRLNPRNIELGLIYAQMLTSEGYFDVSKLVLNTIFFKGE